MTDETRISLTLAGRKRRQMVQTERHMVGQIITMNSCYTEGT